MALINFLIKNIIMNFDCMLQRRCVNHDIVMSTRHRRIPSGEYVFLSFCINNLNTFTN